MGKGLTKEDVDKLLKDYKEMRLLQRLREFRDKKEKTKKNLLERYKKIR